MLTFLSIVFSIDQVLLALLIVCLLVIIRWHKKQPDNFPPGPNGIPFLGTFPLGGKKLPASYKKWSLEKYGAVMSVRVGSHIHVVLNTFGSINEVWPTFAESLFHENIEIYLSYFLKVYFHYCLFVVIVKVH